MVLIYAVFLLFFSWLTAFRYRKEFKRNSLVNEVSKKEIKMLWVIAIIVFIISLLLSGMQSYDFISSIFQSDVEKWIDIPTNLEQYSIIGDIGLSILKILWIPAKMTKYILQVVFSTLSVFVFYCFNGVKKFKKIPKHIRNIVYFVCLFDFIYIIFAIF